MAKENWSARIEAALKTELQEFIKNTTYTNEDIVIHGYAALSHFKSRDNDLDLISESYDQQVFEADSFNITLFEEINIANFSRSDLQQMLARISFWKPYNTLLKMSNGRYLFVKSVDQSIDEITFGVIGEELESVISLQRIINEVQNISQIFERKVG